MSTLARFGCAVAIGGLLLGARPDGAIGQERWVSGHASVAATPARGGGLGTALSAEVGVWGAFRLSLQRVAWEGLTSCTLPDVASECGNRPVMWDAAVNLGLGTTGRVAPFLGAGFALYRRTPSPGGDRTSSPSVSLTLGMHVIPLADYPVSVRLAVLHQEVLDEALTRVYDHRLRFTGFQVGLGYARW